MPSQLVNNSAVYFMCARNFLWDGEEYKIGDEFDQDISPGRIDLLVRTRRVIPVVDDASDKPRHWHHHVWLRSDLSKKLGLLNNSRVTTLTGESLHNKPTQHNIFFPSAETTPAEKDASTQIHDLAHEAALTEKVLRDENQETLSDGCVGEHDPAGNPDCEVGPAEPQNINDPAQRSDLTEDEETGELVPHVIDESDEEEDVFDEDDLYDPSEHSVTDVNAYLEDEDLSDEERQRVLAAERNGKARKGILGE